MNVCILYHPALSQGSTVALQFMHPGHWLTCARSRCDYGTCPGDSFEESDWTTCWGQVFQMYRGAGPGNIVNGDFVGLYYPHGDRWFSMWEGVAQKASCPGNPSSASGFQDFKKWFKCAGEVFQVYAKGKQLGATIIDQDIITLYYPADIQNVVFTSSEVTLSRCMGEKSDYSRPPNNHVFDECENMDVRISIHD